MSDDLLVIDAGAVLTPFERFSPGRVVVRQNCIEAAGAPADVAVPDGAFRIDASHLTLVPGFIEPHIHGCAGADVMDATWKSMDVISRTLPRYGTTSFLPTTVSSRTEILGAAIESLGRLLKEDFQGARPLGIHLEGPFISVHKRGTHRAANVHPPDMALLSAWIERAPGALKLLTMAPELEGAGGLARLSQESDIVPAMGHSEASFEETSSAATRGIRYAVHTFNAMRPMSHRDPGMTGAVLADDRIFAEIIADGVHVDPAVVRIFAKAKGPFRIILATDAGSATGMPDGRYALGKHSVEVAGGVCRDEEGRLAGSTLTQDAALRNFIEWSGMRLSEALMALTSNPAEALRLEGRGRIEAGAHADLTLLDGDLRVAMTFVGGRRVFERVKFDSSPRAGGVPGD